MSDKTPDRTGTYLGIPYDWRRPTWRRLKATVWNPDVDRVFVPTVFGWNYGFNLHALLRRLRLIRPA